MTTNERIAAAVDALLVARHEQRQQLARALGRSPSWTTQKLKGQRQWTGDDLDALAAHFGVHPAALLIPPAPVAA